jgi:hypothetical protein
MHERDGRLSSLSSDSCRGHRPDFRNSVVGVWRFIGKERYLHIEHGISRLKRGLELKAVEQRAEL